jgi:putative RNA 2'-phosphotransferase
MPISKIQLSKLLSLVLRHQPEKIGISLDIDGWTDVSDLIARSTAFGQPFNIDDLVQIVSGGDKRRFELSDNNLQIRALQGHSTNLVDRDFPVQTPPETLYHGTATRFLEAILLSGLVARDRHYVHLSATIQTALEVGRRHGKPTVLSIDAARAHAAGLEFAKSENDVWLIRALPAEFISVI